MVGHIIICTFAVFFSFFFCGRLARPLILGPGNPGHIILRASLFGRPILTALTRILQLLKWTKELTQRYLLRPLKKAYFSSLKSCKNTVVVFFLHYPSISISFIISLPFKPNLVTNSSQIHILFIFFNRDSFKKLFKTRICQTLAKRAKIWKKWFKSHLATMSK